MEENKYKIRFGTLQELYDVGKKVNLINLDERATTLRAAQVEKIFEKVLLHCRSIIKLFSVENRDFSEIDIGLIASAARNIIDSANLYFYISERGISEEEIRFRYNLQLLNYDKNVKNIFKKFDFSLTSFRMQLIGAENARNEIKNSSIYVNANNDEKSIMLSGKQFFDKKELKIIDNNIESGIYNLLSNSIHSFYIGLSNNSFTRSSVFASFIDSIMLSIIAVEVAIIYTANIMNDYILLRKKLGKKISSSERTNIKNLMKADYLYNYLDCQRDFFNSDIFSSIKIVF